MILLVNLIC